MGAAGVLEVAVVVAVDEAVGLAGLLVSGDDRGAVRSSGQVQEAPLIRGVACQKLVEREVLNREGRCGRWERGRESRDGA